MTKLTMLRIEKNLKQAELAAKIGKSRSTLSLYEAGKVIPSYDVVLRLKEILNYYKDDLFEDVKGKRRTVKNTNKDFSKRDNQSM